MDSGSYPMSANCPLNVLSLSWAVSNEQPIGQSIPGFVVGTASTSGFLEADRLGSGNGRVYTLTYQGTVTVPHDQGQ
jgi:hypothetical protein